MRHTPVILIYLTVPLIFYGWMQVKPFFMYVLERETVSELEPQEQNIWLQKKHFFNIFFFLYLPKCSDVVGKQKLILITKKQLEVQAKKHKRAKSRTNTKTGKHETL